MVQPILINGPGKTYFYWNIDANVGARSPNREDDVQLVQMGFLGVAKSPHPYPPDVRSAAAAVTLGSACTGRDDDPLVRAIRAYQKLQGGVQDGHVSRVATATGSYAGGQSYNLIGLVNQIYHLIPNDFPRLDKYPGCPPALQVSVAASCTRPPIR
jgi:hypothetical protein